MAQARLPMRKIRELLRLKFDLGLSIHKIAASLSIARSTVTACLRRIAAVEISWPLPDDLQDDALEALLYPKKVVAADVPLPDFWTLGAFATLLSAIVVAAAIEGIEERDREPWRAWSLNWPVWLRSRLFSPLEFGERGHRHSLR